MSSPYGGFYLNAINRKEQKKFVESKQIFMQLTFSIEKARQCLLSHSDKCLLGEPYSIEQDDWQVNIQPSILDSGLLQLNCTFRQTSEDDDIAHQVITLSGGEKVTTFLADMPEIAINLSASLIAKD